MVKAVGFPQGNQGEKKPQKHLENIFLPLLNQHLSPETSHTAEKPCTAGSVICTAQPRDTTFWDLRLQLQKAQGGSEEQKENDKHRVNTHGFLQSSLVWVLFFFFGKKQSCNEEVGRHPPSS